MGQIMDLGIDAAYKHEGYVAHLLDDGTTNNGSHNAQTRPRMTGQLQAACECGWLGPVQWATDSDRRDGFASDELEAQIMADWEVHVYTKVGEQQNRDHATLIRVLRGLGRTGEELDNGSAHPDTLTQLHKRLAYARELLNTIKPAADDDE